MLYGDIVEFSLVNDERGDPMVKTTINGDSIEAVTKAARKMAKAMFDALEIPPRKTPESYTYDGLGEYGKDWVLLNG